MKSVSLRLLFVKDAIFVNAQLYVKILRLRCVLKHSDDLIYVIQAAQKETHAECQSVFIMVLKLITNTEKSLSNHDLEYLSVLPTR